jgi:hypothetical protein
MKLAARKFATILWASAVIVAVSLWADAALTPFPGYGPPEQYAQMLVLVTFAYTIAGAGLLVAFGAVIYVLGEIRDRVVDSARE